MHMFFKALCVVTHAMVTVTSICLLLHVYCCQLNKTASVRPSVRSHTLFTVVAFFSIILSYRKNIGNKILFDVNETYFVLFDIFENICYVLRSG